MKIIFFLIFLIKQFNITFGQDSIQDVAIIDIHKIDSIIELTNRAKLIEKVIHGYVEPFSGVSGIAFLDPERTEIKKMQITVLATGELITYYCINNLIQVIVTLRALYYRSKNKYFVFHILKYGELLTEQQLQLQDEFLRNIMSLVLKR